MHGDKGKPYRERYRQHDNQAWTPSSEKDEYHQPHKQCALPQCRGHSCGRLVYQCPLIVVGDCLHALRQAGVDFLKALLHPCDHIGCIGAIELQNQTRNDLPLAVCGCKSLTDTPAHGDMAKVAHTHGASVFNGNDNLSEVFDRSGKPDPAYRVLFGPYFEKLRAFCLVSTPQRADHIGNLDIIGEQRIGIEPDLILFFVAAEGQYFRDTRNGLQLVFDDPVLDFTHLDKVAFAGLVFQTEIQDNAKPGRYRPHLRVAKSLGDVATRLGKPLTHHLAGEIDIRAVLEIDVYHRQSKIRDRAHVLEFRQTRHCRFDGVGHIAFNLFRCEPLGFGEDLDQRWRHIRKGIDRQGAKRKKPANRHRKSRDGGQKPSAGDAVHKIGHDQLS